MVFNTLSVDYKRVVDRMEKTSNSNSNWTFIALNLPKRYKPSLTWAAKLTRMVEQTQMSGQELARLGQYTFN